MRLDSLADNLDKMFRESEHRTGERRRRWITQKTGQLADKGVGLQLQSMASTGATMTWSKRQPSPDDIDAVQIRIEPSVLVHVPTWKATVSYRSGRVARIDHAHRAMVNDPATAVQTGTAQAVERIAKALTRLWMFVDDWYEWRDTGDLFEHPDDVSDAAKRLVKAQKRIHEWDKTAYPKGLKAITRLLAEHAAGVNLFYAADGALSTVELTTVADPPGTLRRMSKPERVVSSNPENAPRLAAIALIQTGRGPQARRRLDATREGGVVLAALRERHGRKRADKDLRKTLEIIWDHPNARTLSIIMDAATGSV